MWGDNTATIQTNNVSALSIIRNVVLQKAIESNLQIDVLPEFQKGATIEMVENILDQFTAHRDLLK